MHYLCKVNYHYQKLNFMLMKKTFLLLSVVFFQLTAFAQTPEAPTISSFSDYYALNGYGEITFNLPAKDTEGNALDTKKLFYNIYFDNDAYTFTNDWYSKVKADMKDVPYDYNDNLDFFVTGEKHDVFFYVEDYTHVGVQAIYKDGEKVHRSAIVYNDGKVVTGISQTHTDGQKVEKTLCTDLMGRRVDKSYHGIRLLTKVYGNGERHTVKMLK